MRNSLEKKNPKHIENIDSNTNTKLRSDVFITDNQTERRKRPQRKQIISNSSHHGCDHTSEQIN